MLRMDEINKIKKAYLNGASVNEIAIKYSRSWLTVKRIIDTSLEELENRGRRPNKKGKVVTSEVKEAIRAYLTNEEQYRVKKKQRYTAAFIYKELKASGVYKGSIRQLQDVVKRLREECGQVKPKSYLPLKFPLGSTVQVDHGECDLIIGSQRVKLDSPVFGYISAQGNFLGLQPSWLLSKNPKRFMIQIVDLVMEMDKNFPFQCQSCV